MKFITDVSIPTAAVQLLKDWGHSVVRNVFWPGDWTACQSQ
jgi:hypothetical protein